MVGYIGTKECDICNQNIEIREMINNGMIFPDLDGVVSAALCDDPSCEARLRVFKVECGRPGDEAILAHNTCKILGEIPQSEVYAETNNGSENRGYKNNGSENYGYRNNGVRNSGRGNRGSENSGINNCGYQNHGSNNLGAYNTGDYNTGDYNRGKSNIGYGNFGKNNIGSKNIGFFNIGVRNLGVFNTGGFQYENENIVRSDEEIKTLNRKIFMFNRPTDWTFKRFMASRAFELLFDDSLSPENIFSEIPSLRESMPNFDEIIMCKILAEYGYYDEDRPLF